jgi:hypothetical protein
VRIAMRNTSIRVMQHVATQPNAQRAPTPQQRTT